MKKFLGAAVTILLCAAILAAGLHLHAAFVPAWTNMENAESVSEILQNLKNFFLPVVKDAVQRHANAMAVKGEADTVLDLALIGKGAKETGTVFPVNLYPYRGMLDEKGKAVYDRAYDNAAAVNGESFLISGSLSEAELNNVMSALYNDHPELFWLKTSFTYGYLEGAGAVSLRLDFNSCAEEIENCRDLFKAAAAKILQDAAFCETVFEKEKAIHNALLERTEYDAEADCDQSAYSALVLGKSVCAGYARAFQYLMQEAGIPCYYCEGMAEEGGHAWNIVLLPQGYTNVDPSWNDGDPILYDWFNVPDSVLEADHVRTGLSTGLPRCSASVNE